MSNTQNRMLMLLVLLQTLTLGIMGVQFFNPPAPSVDSFPVAESKAANEPMLPATGQAHTTAELAALLRTVMRDELKKLALPVPADSTGSQQDIEISQQERQDALAASTTVIQQAASAGIWTRDDNLALLPHLNKLSSHERQALMDRLYSAINRKEIRLQDLPML